MIKLDTMSGLKQLMSSLVNILSLKTGTKKKDLKCLITTGQFGDTRVIAIKPTTLMNNSGDSVQLVINYFKSTTSQLLAVYDELDIDFGLIRTSSGGSSAGHNGVKSLIKHLGQDFNRIRIGIGPKKPDQIDSSDFVLSKFSEDESQKLPAIKKEAVSLIVEFIYGGQINPETRSIFL